MLFEGFWETPDRYPCAECGDDLTPDEEGVCRHCHDLLIHVENSPPIEVYVPPKVDTWAARRAQICAEQVAECLHKRDHLTTREYQREAWLDAAQDWATSFRAYDKIRSGGSHG